MIKMIVMDMDGTLLNSDNHIMPQTKAALLAVQQKGIRLVLASGRSYTRLMPYVEELGMIEHGGYLVEINGTAIYDLQQGHREVLSQIEIQQAKELFQYFQKWDVEILGQWDDGMYCYMSEHLYHEKQQYRKTHHIAKDIPWTAGPYAFIFDNREGYPELIYIHSKDEIKRSLNKVSVTYHEDIMEEIQQLAKITLKEKYWAGMVSKRWLEIMPKAISKASGLKEISKRTGISLTEMMAFGDSENDIEMLRECGYSVVMGNALKGVKAYGDEVCESNEAEGIAITLKKHFAI